MVDLSSNKIADQGAQYLADAFEKSKVINDHSLTLNDAIERFL